MRMLATLDKAKPERLKLGGGHVYDRSSVYIAVVALATNSRA
jgi:hypothetical protein